MPLASPLSRRTVLAASLSACSLLAGCSGGSPQETQTSDTTTGAADEDETSMTDEDDPTVTEELDLREANVTEVSVESSGGNSYRFDVTLFHDDDGEDEYANWWQVEDLDGNRLGRRDLLHAHSTAPFTRSETIEIPEGVDCVVVRGHDQIHGYGGQAMLVDVATGEASAVRQGSDPQSFEESECR